MEEHLGIELRSEKVRNIIGKIPPSLIRYGISYITLLLLLIGFSVFYIPYQESVDSKVVVLSVSKQKVTARALLPYSYVLRVKINMSVLEDYESGGRNSITGSIAKVEDRLLTIKGNDYFSTIIQWNNKKPLPYLKVGMNGTIFILLSDTSLIEYLCKKKS